MLKLENAKDCLIFNFRKVQLEIRQKKERNYVYLYLGRAFSFTLSL